MTNEARSEQSQTTASPISRGRRGGPWDVLPPPPFSASGSPSMKNSVIGVRITPGTHGIHTDALVGILEGSRLGEPEDRMLSRHVGGFAREADESGNGRGIDDRAPALLEHLANLVLHAQEHRCLSHAHDPLEDILGIVMDEGTSAQIANVVVREVEPPELLNRRVDHSCDVSGVDTSASMSMLSTPVSSTSSTVCAAGSGSMSTTATRAPALAKATALA